MVVAFAVILVAGCGGRSTPAPRPGVVIQDGEVEFLHPISFVPGSAELAPPTDQLDAIAKKLQDNPGMTLAIQVRVPSDRSGAVARQQLAEERAKAVVDYLLARQVDPARLDAKGSDAAPSVPRGEVSFVITKGE